MNEAQEYWRANVKLLSILLVIWFTVSYLFGIVFFEQLNSIRVGGVGLGFWFAQQGSIYAFLILILIYAYCMNSLDKKYNMQED